MGSSLVLPPEHLCQRNRTQLSYVLKYHQTCPGIPTLEPSLLLRTMLSTTGSKTTSFLKFRAIPQLSDKTGRSKQQARVRWCRETCCTYESIELEIAEQNDILENDDIILSPRLISAARIQLKKELVVEMVMNEDEDDEDEEPNMMDSTEAHDVAAIRRGDPHSICLNAAKRTMKVTMQLGVRSLVHPAQCRFRTAMPHL